MHLPNGSKVFIEGKRDAEIAFTKMTNDKKNPVVTVADASKVAAKDIVVITNSAWSGVINKVVRVKSVDTTAKTVTLEEMDTSDLNLFPAGGAGSLAKVSGWIELPCVQDVGKEGGEQQYYNYQCLADEEEQSEPTYKSAVTLTYNFAHDYTNAVYETLRAGDKAKEVKAFYMYVPRAKEVRYWSGVPSFDDIPSTAVNEMETVQLSIALKGRHVFLPSA